MSEATIGDITQSEQPTPLSIDRQEQGMDLWGFALSIMNG